MKRRISFKENPYTITGQIIMSYCVTKNITISEFARRIHTRLSTVSMWVHGSRYTVKREVLPREDSLNKIKEYIPEVYVVLRAHVSNSKE